MSELENELFADLMEKVEDEQENMAAVSEGMVNPILVAVIRTWVANQVRRLACENKDAILQTVQRYIDTYVKNDQVAVVLMNVADAVVETVCTQ